MSAIQKQDGGSAFPELDREWDDDLRTYRYASSGGMTLRDYFAAKALAALITDGPQLRKSTPEGVLLVTGRSGYATVAYEYADAMLKARTE